MTHDPLAIESDMERLAGALRALSGLFHSARNDLDLCKPDDLGYLVACLAAEAERTSRAATACMLQTDMIDQAVSALRSTRRA
ncbi:MAG: hypothetical protein ACRDBL_08950 [Rhabdaerophilum sp.]